VKLKKTENAVASPGASAEMRMERIFMHALAAG
jgi:hypothetical protein